MNQEQAEKNVRLYYWYEVFSEPIFLGPILILYIQKIGQMTLAEIFFMESVCVFVKIILEIPSGALADLIGRKKTVLFGEIMIFLATIILAFGDGRLAIWLCNVIFFMGYTFISGADDALLFDSLKFLNRRKDFRRVMGRSVACRLWLIAMCSLAVGYLAEINLRLPLILCVLPLLADVIIIGRFTEPPFAGHNRYDFNEHLRTTMNGLSVFWRNSKIIWITTLFVLLSVTSKLWFFTYNPYFELVGLKLSNFGQIFFLLNVVAATTSYGADWLSKRVSDKASIILMVGFLAVPILVMGALPLKITALLVLCQNLIRGYMNPFTDHIMHAHLESQSRATVFSIRSAISGLAQAVFMTLFGFVLTFSALPESMILLGFFSLFFGLILILTYSKVFVQRAD